MKTTPSTAPPIPWKRSAPSREDELPGYPSVLGALPVSRHGIPWFLPGASGELYDRVEGLRLASIEISSGEELGAAAREALLAEFRATDVSIFRIQERRDALLKLYQKKSRIREKVLAERRKRALDLPAAPSGDENAPLERDYWRRRRARNRKD